MELTIGGQRYRTGKMPAFPQQFHVARRIAPALFAGGAALNSALKGNLAAATDGDAAFFFEGVAKAIGDLSDKDAEYVLGTCLDCCVREQEGSKWAPVKAPGAGGRMMFEDIDLPVMLQLAVTVIQENLANFLSILSGSPAS